MRYTKNRSYFSVVLWFFENSKRRLLVEFDFEVTMWHFAQQLIDNLGQNCCMDLFLSKWYDSNMETRFPITEWISKKRRYKMMRSASEAYHTFLLFHFYSDFQLKCLTKLKVPNGFIPKAPNIFSKII